LRYAAILKNDDTGRYHPILFRPAPRPSDDVEEGKACRHRSVGHHTDGFDTVEKAQEMVGQRPDLFDTGLLLTWDGFETPACTLDLPLRGEPGSSPSGP
jgi:hypothetical protein